MAARKKISSDALNKARMLLIDAVDGGENDEAVKIAVAVITRDYYNDVKGIGDNLIEQIKEGEITDAEKFDELLHQDVDGSGRVIYTWQARLGLIATEELDAYEEDFGEKPESPEKQLFVAMAREVRAYVEREVGGDIEEFISEQLQSPKRKGR